MVRVKMGWRLSLLFLAGITGCDSLSSLWRESLVVAGRAPPLRLLGVHHQLQLSLLPLACITGCAFLSSGGTVTLAERALPFFLWGTDFMRELYLMMHHLKPYALP